MSTADADPGNPSSPDGAWDGQQPQDLLPGQPQARELELDAYGVPVRERPAQGRAYRLPLVSLAFGIASIGLAITDLVAHGIVAGYLVVLGMVSGILAGFLGSVTAAVMEQKLPKGNQLVVVSRICQAAALLGILGVIGLAIGSGHGAALNSTP